jgi:hypothetical protein
MAPIRIALSPYVRYLPDQQEVTFMGTFVPWDLPIESARVLEQIQRILRAPPEVGDIVYGRSQETGNCRRV